MQKHNISDERRALYYLGLLLTLIGFLSFGSVFVTGALNFGNFENFTGQVQSAAFRAIAGMAMMMLGGVLTAVGRAGLAGSGVVLDPERARGDMEPWSRMAGGMLKDTLDEAGIEIGKRRDAPAAAPEFADRLRKLHALREEGILTEEEYQREKAEILDEPR